MNRVLFTLLIMGVVFATSVGCKKDDKKNSSTSKLSDAPKSTHFPDPGEYLYEGDWNFREFITFNSGVDSIRYRRHYLLNFKYMIHKVSFFPEENKWIGIGTAHDGGAGVAETEGVYYVYFFKDVKKNSVQILRKSFKTEAEANEFVIPAEPEWKEFIRQ